MEFRQLQQFVAVAEQGTISAAARSLNLAQPAISTSIKKLEAELNTVLFQRRERGVSLTNAGQQFLLHAKQILQQANDAKLMMHSLEGLDQGQMEIGVPSMLGSYYFPPLLMAFKHLHPGLELNIVDSGTRNIRDLLVAGDLELGVVADKDLTPELASGKLIREEMVVCMAADHPLAELTKIEYRDFLAHDLVLFRKGYYHHIVIDTISRKEQVRPKVGFTSNLLPLIKSVIRQGYAISPMWKVAIQDDDNIVTRPFAEPFYVDLSLAWRHDRYISRANQAFREFVLQQVREQQFLETDH
jgi:DNA-binding transcriptional LysR family regulator